MLHKEERDRIAKDIPHSYTSMDTLRKAINDDGLKLILIKLALIANEGAVNQPEFNWSNDARMLESIIPFIEN